MKGTRSVSNFTFFACGCLIVTTPFVEKILLSPLNFLCSFVKDKLTTCVGLHLGSIVLHWSILYSFTGITSSSISPPNFILLEYCVDCVGTIAKLTF